MITSTSNNRIKEILNLKKKPKARRESGLFIIEGTRMAEETPEDLLEKIYVSESFLKKEIHSPLLEMHSYEIVSDKVFSQLSDTVTPQGILCVVRQPNYTLEDITRGEAPLLLVLENLLDPGNLGTIVRTGEGAGVSGILLTKDAVDMYNPKVVRSTMGAIYRVPFLYLEDIETILQQLRQKNITTYAAHLEKSESYDSYDYGKGTAFIIGNEGNGLSDRALENAEKRLFIPMCGQVESLNAAVAASILMYEAARQRRNS